MPLRNEHHPANTMQRTVTAFAVLDVLGYGALMEREPQEVALLIRELVNTSEHHWRVQRDLNRFIHFSGSSRAPVIEYLHFSDTLLIYLCSDPPLFQPAQLVEAVCYAASVTLACFIATGIPLRGAVGFGPTFISRKPLFFTGKELYATMKLEREQAWAGAVLHKSAKFEAITRGGFVVDYDVPMSNECYGSVPTNLAIDWVSCLVGSLPQIVPPWDKMFLSDKDKIREKKEETKRFFETLQRQPRSVPGYLTDKTINAMRERLARLLHNSD